MGRSLIVVCAVGVLTLAHCSLPASAAVTRSGKLQATVFDDFRSGRSVTHYELKSGSEEIAVRPTELAAEPGDRVAITGKIEDGRLVGSVEATGASPQVEALTPGPRKVAVLLATFPGESAEPWSVAATRSEVFTGTRSVSAFYEEESYGEASLTGKLRSDGDVFGWYSIDAPTAGCPYGTWKDKTDEAAAEAGVDLSGYQHIIYEVPYQSSCSWLGIAGLNSDWAVINGSHFSDKGQVTAHELGHDLGLQHAGSWTCTSGGERVQISGECTVTEYGDPFDVMGNRGYRHSNGWNLDKLGFLSPENVETIESSGTYSLHSALYPTTEPTLLRVPRKESSGGAVTSWYYLEIRQTGGVFENFADASTEGVSIRATAEDSSPETLLLDADPGTASFYDAPLGVGETFDGGPVQIETVTAGAGSATVSIQLDEEPPTKPDVQATVGADGVRLSWTSTDNVGVYRYYVLRDGEQLGSATSPSFVDRRPPVGDHDYVVVAEDEAHNRSDPSDPLTVTVPVISGPDCAEGRCRLAYRYSGGPSNWVVPPGVDEAFLTVEGAGGGGGVAPERVAGNGARVLARLESLTPGEVAEIVIGGQGEPYSAGGGGGFNGGGDGGLGGGGGGYTTLTLDSTLQVLAAGGGGGGLNGVNGESSPPGGSGGAGGEGGRDGRRGWQTTAQGATLRGGAGGGKGGSGGAGGEGGQVTGSSACPGGAHAGVSGAPGAGSAGGGGVAAAGGGGGGGFAGGGQGGGGAGDECGAAAASGGGGGGSSYVAPGHLNGYDTAGDGDGWLSIQYDNPAIEPEPEPEESEPPEEGEAPGGGESPGGGGGGGGGGATDSEPAPGPVAESPAPRPAPAPPRIAIAAVRAPVSHGVAKLRLVCRGTHGGRCRGVVLLSRRGLLGRARYVVPAGRRRTVRVRLRRAALRRLRRSRRHLLRVRAILSGSRRRTVVLHLHTRGSGRSPVRKQRSSHH